MIFPALRSPAPEIHWQHRQLVTFCSTTCRARYRAVLVECGMPGWEPVESSDARPRNWHGTEYWRAACSTCGVALGEAA